MNAYMQRNSVVTNHDSRSQVTLKSGSLSAQKMRAAQISQLSGGKQGGPANVAANVASTRTQLKKSQELLG